MALIWADSFDHYGAANGTPASDNIGRTNMLQGAYAGVSGFTTGPSKLQARTGEASLYFPSNTVSARRILPGPGRRVIGFGAGVFFAALPTTNFRSGFGFKNSANDVIVAFYFQSDGAITISRQPTSVVNNGTILGSTDAGVLSASTWQHVEAAVLIDPIVGWVEIRVDGVTVFRLENINTGAVGNWATSIQFNQLFLTAAVPVTFWDDIFAWDDSADKNNDFLGPVRILTLFSTEDGPVQNWDVVGASDAHEAVDEVPPDGDTTHLGAAEVGDRVELMCPELPPEIISLPGIFVHTMSRIEEAGVGRISIAMVDAGGEVEQAPEQNQTPVYTYRGFVFQENPDTGDVWTKETFEAAKLRIDKTM